MKLSKEELDNELMYLTSKNILKEMIFNHLITKEQYLLIKRELLDIYHPLISGLWEEE